ncbi:glycoside hydrolase family 36 N-terminal domain-containing protein [Streptomyces sp. B21-083]|uniref:glycoside hydrolase family 36 N-terminal domain-containing protein n=1 Tax=Streptomyces sp. B21-083 TaxID=3039410 RepID=UPI002FF0092B
MPRPWTCCPAPAPERGRIAANTGGALWRRWRLSGGREDLDEPISLLRCTGHQEECVQHDGADVRTLRVAMADEATGLHVTAVYSLRDDIPVLRAEAHVENRGDHPFTLEYVSSSALSNLASHLPDGASWEDGLSLWLAANPWSGEFRWTRTTLAERGLYDVGRVAYGQNGSKYRIAVTSTGSWSSSEYLPMGCLEEPVTGRALLWQIEHNGSWHAELADRFGDVYLALSGPTDREHQWRRRLGPGQAFCTVPAAIAVVPERGFEAALAALTDHRRATRRAHPDHDRLPHCLQCLHQQPDGRAQHRGTAATGRSGGGRRRGVLLHRRRLV